MSVAALSNTTDKSSSFQPFQCAVCQSRFTRHENLKRHATLHAKSRNEASLSCDICHATFSRADLRLRHLKRKHPEVPCSKGTKRKRTASDSVAGHRTESTPSKSPPVTRHDTYTQSSGDEEDLRRDDNGVTKPTQSEPNESDYGVRTQRWNEPDARNPHASPPARHAPLSDSTASNQLSRHGGDLEPTSVFMASLLGTESGFDLQTPSAATTHHSIDATLAGFNFDQWSPDKLLFTDPPQIQDDWFPSTTQIARGCDLFFTYCSTYLPFLHQPTFDTTCAPKSLLLSMLCLAYQHGDDPDGMPEVASGDLLSKHCFHRARTLIAGYEENPEELTDAPAMVQAYLFLQLYAMMHSSDNDSAYGLKTHSKMISLARASGLMKTARLEAAETQDLDSLWRQFVRAESCKRTAFAMHQIDTLWYQFMSIPRLVSHLEIKHDLPCPEDYWTASSAGEWAHRQLVSRNGDPSVQYADAVRQILTSSGDITSIPAFDPYGVINITQFLTSSAREISGWSTMTGMLSMERLDPIRASLLGLGALIRPQEKTGSGGPTSLSEATWEAAMIEMQLWSPSHTGGMLANSVDSALDQLTHFAPSREVLCESNIARSIQPHVDWFLHYLDTTIDASYEAPWIILYAWKAFMIAWQLLKGGFPGAMQAAGVQDGSLEGALSWAREVFQRRERWKLGKTVMACVNALEK
ncbi:fungal-specific transcription factor domain-containing protein [Paraphoma chrysanthemicola]|uniref:Fungal-specific transcription factor domain-containing protein n=1 Tax=Paraphoma chrysanthemicola TaxID=798071 RepID=A0A8K0RGI8_9PLEO|nr:fungal-specific transcription factor domain-containing protein [Paraphoma chrysanthemicola]